MEHQSVGTWGSEVPSEGQEVHYSSIESTPGLCLKPLTTKQALYLAIVPSEFCCKANQSHNKLIVDTALNSLSCFVNG
jgi:hypothetical protein